MRTYAAKMVSSVRWSIKSKRERESPNENKSFLLGISTRLKLPFIFKHFPSHAVNFINILRTIFSPIFWCQKLQKLCFGFEMFGAKISMQKLLLEHWWNRPLINQGYWLLDWREGIKYIGKTHRKKIIYFISYITDLIIVMTNLI